MYADVNRRKLLLKISRNFDVMEINYEHFYNHHKHVLMVHVLEYKEK